MAKLVGLGEGKWFELADELAAAGEAPSVKLLHSVAKERFGVAASYTTIQRVLESWKRLGGRDRPQTMNPQFMEIVLRAFAPLYQQLLAQARGEFEPRVMEAERDAYQARRRTEQLEAELAQLLNERQHWREQLQAVTQRERAQAAALASAETKAGELQALIDSTVTAQQQQLAEIQGRINQQEARHAREREQLIEQQRAALAEIKESFEVEIAGLMKRSAVEIDRRDTELATLRESLQQAQQARSALGAQKQVLDKQLASATAVQGDLSRRMDTLLEELKNSQGRVQRAEQALRDARAANAQMEDAYQKRINQLQAQLDALVKGQASIQQHFEELVRQIVHERASSPRPPRK
jgi:chromosome segregation ATPase